MWFVIDIAERGNDPKLIRKAVDITINKLE